MADKLKTVLDNIENLPESVQELYIETKDKDGKVSYILSLDDDVRSHPSVGALQRAHEAQKQANRELKAKVAELEKRVEGLPEDLDPEEWTRLKELENQLKEKGDGDDPEKRKEHEAQVQAVKKMHEQQIERLKKQMADGFAERDAKAKELNTRIQQMVVDDGLTKLLIESGVKKEVLPYVSAKLKQSIKVSEEDGEYVARVDTDLGEQTLTEFIPKWAQSDDAKVFVEQPKGGGAEGGNRRPGSFNDNNPYSKAFWDMSRQADIVKRDPGKADRLARQAGHKRALGALLMDAK